MRAWRRRSFNMQLRSCFSKRGSSLISDSITSAGVSPRQSGRNSKLSKSGHLRRGHVVDLHQFHWILLHSNPVDTREYAEKKALLELARHWMQAAVRKESAVAVTYSSSDGAL